MKGESREIKGRKSTGGGRIWYGKRETLTPLYPPSPPPIISYKNGTSLKDTLVKAKTMGGPCRSLYPLLDFKKVSKI